MIISWSSITYIWIYFSRANNHHSTQHVHSKSTTIIPFRSQGATKFYHSSLQRSAVVDNNGSGNENATKTRENKRFSGRNCHTVNGSRPGTQLIFKKAAYPNESTTNKNLNSRRSKRDHNVPVRRGSRENHAGDNTPTHSISVWRRRLSTCVNSNGKHSEKKSTSDGDLRPGTMYQRQQTPRRQLNRSYETTTACGGRIVTYPNHVLASMCLEGQSPPCQSSRSRAGTGSTPDSQSQSSSTSHEDHGYHHHIQQKPLNAWLSSQESTPRLPNGNDVINNNNAADNNRTSSPATSTQNH